MGRCCWLLKDGLRLLDHELAVGDGGTFSQRTGDLLSEFRWCEAVGGAVGGDELVVQFQGFEEPGDAYCT